MKKRGTKSFSAKSDQNGVSLGVLEDGTELVLVCLHPYLTTSMIVTKLQISGQPLGRTVCQHDPLVTATCDESKRPSWSTVWARMISRMEGQDRKPLNICNIEPRTADRGLWRSCSLVFIAVYSVSADRLTSCVPNPASSDK